MLTSIFKYFRWLFWNAYYLPQFRQPRKLSQWLTRVKRTQWPWWKFKPHLFRNDDGRQWEIYFSNASAVYSRETITLDVGRDMDTGEIVAFTIYDEVMRAVKAREAKK